MATFYMHVFIGNEWVHDPEELECFDSENIPRYVLEGARDLMADQVRRGTIDLTGIIRVDDEQGVEVHRLAFADAINVQRS